MGRRPPEAAPVVGEEALLADGAGALPVLVWLLLLLLLLVPTAESVRFKAPGPISA